ncbi:hypothetical protein HanRHA438_Chr15g0695821 [Helianthus annuus]|nr:hypothetical protein HanRHA438_Chr15g0695821 [Helianthus annuus]
MKMKEPEIIQHVGLDYVENLHPWVVEPSTNLVAVARPWSDLFRYGTSSPKYQAQAF